MAANEALRKSKDEAKRVRKIDEERNVAYNTNRGELRRLARMCYLSRIILNESVEKPFEKKNAAQQLASEEKAGRTVIAPEGYRFHVSFLGPTTTLGIYREGKRNAAHPSGLFSPVERNVGMSHRFYANKIVVDSQGTLIAVAQDQEACVTPTFGEDGFLVRMMPQEGVIEAGQPIILKRFDESFDDSPSS